MSACWQEKIQYEILEGVLQEVKSSIWPGYLENWTKKCEVKTKISIYADERDLIRVNYNFSELFWEHIIPKHAIEARMADVEAVRKERMHRTRTKVSAKRIREETTPRRHEWSSYKGRRANALASGAEERRGKLRKATGSRKQASIRRYLNGAIHRESCPGILWWIK